MACLPEKNADYSRQDYWDERYSTEDSFEWCKSYSAFRHLIRQEIRPSDKILMLGCGNSSLSEDMYRDGYHNITNIDYSQVVIENMKSRSHEARSMQWLVMDIRSMTFEKHSFDVVIEKATLDALLVQERDPWRLSDESRILMDNILSQVSDVLSDGGRFISVTFAQPHFRKRLYARTRYTWDIRTETFGDGFHFFFYVMTKGRILSAGDSLLEQQEDNRNGNERNGPIITLSDDRDEGYLNAIEM